MRDARDTGTGNERPGAALARFFEQRGYRVVDELGVLWAQYRKPFFISLPYDLRIDLDRAELGQALRRSSVAAVRYPTMSQAGWPSGLFICRTRGYSLARVHAKQRSQIRKGTQSCELRWIDPDELLAQGLELNLQTMARHRRFEREFGEKHCWRRFVDAVRRTPEVSVAGAFVRGRLSAYSVACRDGAWLHHLYRNSRVEDFIYGTNPALDFWLLSEAAKQAGLEGVTNSSASVISGGDALGRYKLSLGYELQEHSLAMQFHPALRPVVMNRWTTALTGALTRLRPRNSRLELIDRVVQGALLSRGAARTEA